MSAEALRSNGPTTAVGGVRAQLREWTRTRQEVLLLFGLTLIAAAVRLHGITDKSIWFDEAYVIALAQMSIPDMIRTLAETDILPPLYYLLMHYWIKLGTDPLLVRLPSTLLSVASVPLLYLVGTRLVGRRVALVGATLLSVSSWHVFWAQEARMYTLLGFLCLLSTFTLVRALDGGGRLTWVLHAVVSAAALYSQLSAAFYLAAQDLAVLYLLLRRQAPRSALVPWVLSQVATALLILPWVPALFMQYGAYGDPEEAWTSLGGLQGLLVQFAFAAFPYWRLPFEIGWNVRDVLVIGLLLLAVLGTWFLRHRPTAALVFMLFFGTLGLLALLGVWKGLVLPRTVLPASFAFYLLVGGGLLFWRRRSVLVLGVALIVTLNFVGLARYYSLGSLEDWREAAAYLAEEYEPGELAFVDASAGLMPLNYYLERQGRTVETHGLPFRPWANVPPPLTADDLRQVDDLLSGRAAVWLVIYRNGFPDPDGDLLPYLSSRMRLVDEQHLTKVRLYRFISPAPTVLADAGDFAPPLQPSARGVAAETEAAATEATANPGVYFGAWVGERVNIPGDVTAFETAVGKRLAINHRYSDNPPNNGARLDVAWADSARAAGAIPMLSWQPGFGSGTRSLASVAAGERDEYIGAWADQLRDWGHPIYLRMMWEQNAAWYGWRADQEPRTTDFVEAWRHIVTLMRSRGADNVTFVWSPHVSGAGAAEIMPTYPGDDYVDWVALDGYPFRGGRGDFVETFAKDYDILATTLSKPIMIAETSLESWSDEIKAAWIRQILGQQLPNRFPKVKALVWFEEKNTNGIDYSLLQDQGPLSAEAFRQEIASAYYATNQYGLIATSPIPPPDLAVAGPQPVQVAPANRTRVGGTPPSATPPPATPAPVGNLLVDPGFEEGGSGDWNPAWVVPSWVSSVVRRDTSVAATGSYSMRHASRAGESYTVYQEVPVAAGATYQIGVSARVEEALQFGSVTLEVQSLNEFNGVMESRQITTWRDLTDGWVRTDDSVRVGARAAKARIQLRVNSLRGTINVDDFTFTRSGQ